ASMALIPIAIEAGAEAKLEEASAAMEGELDTLMEETFVVRGGLCEIANFEAKPNEINAAGLLDGASVNSKNGVSVEELSSTIQNGKIGVTTVGKIQKAGGTVKPTWSWKNPYHADLGGITPKQASELFKPVIRNPSKDKN